MTIERLDRSKPPPGWAWYDERHQHVADIRTGRPGLLTPDAAWARHEAQNDPPGVRLVWEPDDRCEPHGAGEWHVEVNIGDSTLLVAWFGFGRKETTREVEARAAAWRWYWRRVDAWNRTATVVRKAQGASDALFVMSALWPDILTWPDAMMDAHEAELTTAEKKSTTSA